MCLASLAPERAKKESMRVINEDETEVRLTINSKLLKKLDRIKNLISHKNPNPSLAELLDYLADSELKRIDPDIKAKRIEASGKRTANNRPHEQTKGQPKMLTPPPTSLAEVVNHRANNNRSIPRTLKQIIWIRAQGCCEYTHPKTEQRCSSKFQLEFDHKIPWSLGGQTRTDNLRLLCRWHNTFEAVRQLGLPVMAQYIPSLR